jgi:hypothetical protein
MNEKEINLTFLEKIEEGLLTFHEDELLRSILSFESHIPENINFQIQTFLSILSTELTEGIRYNTKEFSEKFVVAEALEEIKRLRKTILVS